MVTSGREHLRNRRLLTPRFHTRAVSHHVAAIVDRTVESVLRWPLGRPLIAQDAMHAITLEIILTVFFGVTDERKDALRDALQDVVKAMGPAIAFLPVIRHEFGGIGPWARFQRAIRRLDGLAEQMIDEAGRSEPRDDLLSVLVGVRDEFGQGFTDLEVRDQLISCSSMRVTRRSPARSHGRSIGFTAIPLHSNGCARSWRRRPMVSTVSRRCPTWRPSATRVSGSAPSSRR